MITNNVFYPEKDVMNVVVLSAEYAAIFIRR
jgi:hypothetical protein